MRTTRTSLDPPGLPSGDALPHPADLPGSRRVGAALIVAAGRGTRIGGTVPKPLVEVAGVPLVRRVMVAARRAGLREIAVVIGHEAPRVAEALPGLAPPDVRLAVVDNPAFEEPNGVSLRAGLAAVSGPFALLMADHVFSPDRLVRALEHYETTGRSLLVVEPRDRFSGDLLDATRVRTDGAGRIVSIGKELDDFDAIDTGMFVLDRDAVARALEQTGASPGISDVMRVLAREGQLEALSLTEGYWQDVDTPEDIRAAESRLYASLTKATDGFLARHVNRRISLALSTRVWKLGLRPNHATAATLLLGLGAGVAFAQGASVGWGLLGALLFQLQSILDGVDGELARLTCRESRVGFWFDVVSDNLTHAAVFAGLAMGLEKSGLPGPWSTLGALAVAGVGASLVVFAPLLATPPRRAGGPAARHLQRLVEGLSRRDFTWALFPLVLLGWTAGLLWAAAVGTWVFALAAVYLRLRASAAQRSRYELRPAPPRRPLRPAPSGSPASRSPSPRHQVPS